MFDQAAVDKDLTAWCEAMGRLQSLPLDKADRLEVIGNLRVLARQMSLIDDFAPLDSEDPAQHFRA